MLENIIAVAVAFVVGGGLLTLVYRILRGDTESKRLAAELDALAAPAKSSGGNKGGSKKKKKK